VANAKTYPFIVITNDGLPADKEKYTEQDFAGILVKPFIEAELVKHIILALGYNIVV
jgi:CheY-like chemotaxis protein